MGEWRKHYNTKRPPAPVTFSPIPVLLEQSKNMQ